MQLQAGHFLSHTGASMPVACVIILALRWMYGLLGGEREGETHVLSQPGGLSAKVMALPAHLSPPDDAG